MRKKPQSFDEMMGLDKMIDPFGITGIGLETIEGKAKKKSFPKKTKLKNIRYEQLNTGEAPLDSEESYNYGQSRNVLGENYY